MNTIYLIGKVQSCDSNKFSLHRGNLEVTRLSGVKDIIPFYSMKPLDVDKVYQVSGILDTHKSSCYPRKTTCVLIRSASEYGSHSDKDTLNRVFLSGHIVGKNPLRKTPRTDRTIIDFQLEVSEDGRVIFPSLVAWGSLAKKVDSFEDNTEIMIQGQLQSREYKKNDKTYIIHEISCFEAERL